MYLDKELNELLVDTFNVILKSEEQSLRKNSKADLSVSEYHLIETIAKNGPSTISGIAAAQGITLPSVTIAIKKLEKKGYVEKIKSAEDARSVSVELTEAGKKINEFHQRFHTHMISQITKNISDEEKELLYQVILKLNKYFNKALTVLRGNGKQ